jgi:NAD(P)-dependent dehydrogenase (short-subunit alcohol dehydrogenase family)
VQKVRGRQDTIAQDPLFLASEHDRFITGQDLVVDGGRWMP